MKAKRLAFPFLFFFFTLSTAWSQKAEVSAVLGGSFASDSHLTFCPPGLNCNGGFTTVNKLQTSHQFSWGFAGAYHLGDFKAASLYMELPIARINSQKVGFPFIFNNNGIARLHSTFLTPAFKVELFPKFPISPFGSFGAGWARYATDNFLGTKTTNKGALQFGAGFDIKTLVPHVGLRFEARDFLTGDPNFGSSITSGGFISPPIRGEPGLHRNNLLVGGGPVITF